MRTIKTNKQIGNKLIPPGIGTDHDEMCGILPQEVRNSNAIYT